MKTKALVATLSFVLLINNTALAQNVVGSIQEWESVKALAVGEKLSVRLKDKKKVEGTLRSVSDSLLVLARGTSTVNLNRDSVAKVYRIVPRSTARSIGKTTAMGAGMGFGIGAGVGIWGGSYEDLETAGLVALLGGFGAAVGAGIGALVGGIYVKPGRVLIYEVK